MTSVKKEQSILLKHSRLDFDLSVFVTFPLNYLVNLLVHLEKTLFITCDRPTVYKTTKLITFR